MSVVRLVDHSNDASHINPVDTLQEAIEEHSSGGDWEGRKKLLVLSLDTEDGSFDVSFRNAGMSCSEIMAAIRVMEYQMLESMGIIT